MEISEKYYKKLLSLVNIPILFLFVSQIFVFIQTMNSSRYSNDIHESKMSTVFVFLWFISMVFGILIKVKKLRIDFVLIIIIFLILAIYNILISFNFRAAIESLIKMLFPIVGISYGIVYSSKAKEWFTGLSLIVLVNIIVQVIIFILHFLFGVWLNLRLEQGFLIRSEGLSDFVSFGTMTFASAIFIHRYYFGKFKSLLFWVFISWSVLSFAFKLYPLIFLYLGFFYIKDMGKRLLLMLCIFGFALLYNFSDSFLMSTYRSRMDSYVLSDESVRAQSYQVAYKSLFSNGNIFGEGLGGFGGPSSIKYSSPLYNKYNFNFGELDYITTTDTYYPHLLVEMGLLGFILFFLIIYYPILFKANTNKTPVICILFMLIALNNSLTSFTLESPLSVTFLISTLPMLILYDKWHTTSKFPKEPNQ